MGKFVDLSGQVFGRLTVLHRAGYAKCNKILWLCQCECGSVKEIIGASLIKGSTVSCGCFHHDTVRTHGMTKCPTWMSWTSMKNRCSSETAPSFKYYGGRGITVCERWQNSFENFLLDMGARPEGHSIERVDNDKGYNPENCKWATMAEQSKNKRVSSAAARFIYEGGTYTIRELSEKVGLGRKLLSDRIFMLGWSVEKAVTLPSRTGNYKRSGSQHNANY